MKLKPVRFAPQEDGKCICGFDPARIRPNDAGRFFCPQSGHEWEEDKPAEAETEEGRVEVEEEAASGGRTEEEAASAGSAEEEAASGGRTEEEAASAAAPLA